MQKTTAVAPAQAQSRPLLAIGLLCAACALFALGDTTAKYLATNVGVPIGQIVWMRYFGQFVGTVAMLGLIAVPAMLRTTKLKAQLFRSVLLLISTVCNFWALHYLRLDQTTTISFLTPHDGRPAGRDRFSASGSAGGARSASRSGSAAS